MLVSKRKVVAVDATNDTEGGNMTLIIKLNDINDNTPIFTQQHGYNFYGNSTGIIGQVNTTDKDSLSGGVIVVVYAATYASQASATDKDSDDNAAIQYIIPETITSRYFSINETTGNISLSDVILPNGKEFFQLIIIARDKGNPPLQSSCNVYISRTFITDSSVRIEAPLESTVLKAQHSEYERVVLQNMEGIQLLFLQENPSIVSQDPTFTASQIGLVVLAAIILVGAFLQLYLFLGKRGKPSDESSVSSVDEERHP
ncbi:unnamed protein product [Mytilus edulis]|uniref:Cadherin domain-containing protein n=1 Tax=Mytilus edulis TaxID=6550 RepID=A0A8S3VDA1_MYTED|nr:unnamed protein product [Mytilus edulis]